MATQTLPSEFYEALVQEITEAGYYRLNPSIELRIDDDVISLVSTSTIVPFNNETSISRPKAGAARGLKLLDQSYLVAGKEVTKPVPLTSNTDDCFCVRFKRKSAAVTKVTDKHLWVSPVTDFTVTFKHGDSHSCGFRKLDGRVVGLQSKQVDKGCIVYTYPRASFSGQGFTWSVNWLS
jgi:hypothetical protein